MTRDTPTLQARGRGLLEHGCFNDFLEHESSLRSNKNEFCRRGVRFLIDVAERNYETLMGSGG